LALAHVEIFFLTPVMAAPIAFHFSALYSHTPGTPRKSVG